MNSYRTKLGRELRVGDILIWHTNGKQGMRLATMAAHGDDYPHEGTTFMMILEGLKAGEPHTICECILDDEQYMLHHDSPQPRWPL